jgi:hypothetical protein
LKFSVIAEMPLYFFRSYRVYSILSENLILLLDRIVTRQAKETATYNGITIPAGMNIQADVWGLHHDNEFWEQPTVFNPER